VEWPVAEAVSSARELAFAKANLVLHVGPPRADGLHPLCSLMASLDLADDVELSEREGEDLVLCPGVPGHNLAERALRLFREEVPGSLPPLEIRIEKRIPVAAGLGGGSADAAAVLRAANRLAGRPLDPDRLRALGARLGSDVPGLVEPAHALVSGTGEIVERVALTPMAFVLVPQEEGLRTPEVYAELDRLGGHRATLDGGRLRELAGAPLVELGRAVENDLQRAAISLRPELERPLRELRAAGALAAAISGSGPTAFGLFPSIDDARRAANRIEGSLAASARRVP
jgi:4-diphosphocytidyl-2-C-methyl-D-erythritol kinase